MSETYERALTRISKNNKSIIARNVFRWVLVARRPLSVKELGEAVVIEPGQHFLRPGQLISDIDHIVPWCGNLLVQDVEDNVVHFAHHTVKEFLLSQRSDPALQCFQFNLIDADHGAGETCCTYLHLDNLTKQVIKVVHIEPTAVINAALPGGRTATILKPYIKLTRSSKRRHGNFDLGRQLCSLSDISEMQQQTQHPFLSYASEYWLSHTTTFSEGLSKTWNLFDHLVSTEEARGIRKWSSIELKQYVTDHSHWALLAWKWNRYNDGLGRPEGALSLREFHMSRIYAEQHGRLLLLAAESPFHGALDIVSQAGLWCKLERAIETAARRGDLGLLETILSVKNPERYKNPRPNINQALQYAAKLGHFEVIRRLLAVKSANRSSVPIDINRMITIAGAAGHEILAIMLSDIKKEIDAKRLLLAESVVAGDLSKVKASLESGVDVNALVNGSTALQRAAENNRPDVVNLLFDYQANIRVGAFTPKGTVLQEAVREGRVEIVVVICRASLAEQEQGDGEFGIRQRHLSKVPGVSILAAGNSEGHKTIEFLNFLNASDISEDGRFVIWEFLVRFEYIDVTEVPSKYKVSIEGSLSGCYQLKLVR